MRLLHDETLVLFLLHFLHLLFHLLVLLLLFHLFLLLRSWTGLARTTTTLCHPPTLASAKPSRRTRRRTPRCSPEHSRTKPSMCTGSRRNAKRAAESPDRPSNTGKNTRTRMEGARQKGRRRGEDGPLFYDVLETVGQKSDMVLHCFC